VGKLDSSERRRHGRVCFCQLDSSDLPAGKNIPVRVAFSHWNLIFPPNQPNFKFLAMGMEVGDAYNNAIQAILDHPELSQWEYVLTVEHDNTPPADGVLMLIETLALPISTTKYYCTKYCVFIYTTT
jgi:hypothetical protein